MYGLPEIISSNIFGVDLILLTGMSVIAMAPRPPWPGNVVMSMADVSMKPYD